MITIHGQIPSSKNTIRFGKRRPYYAKPVTDYKANTKYAFMISAKLFRDMAKGKDKPLRVEFKIFREDNRQFDFVNIIQIVQDEMVRHGWIDDDNAKELLPVFVPYEVDKINPRVEIRVI